MMNTHTGDLTMLASDDLRIKNPPEGTVILHGSEADVRRVSAAVQGQHKADQAKAKRKAQRAARKRNR